MYFNHILINRWRWCKSNLRRCSKCFNQRRGQVSYCFSSYTCIKGVQFGSQNFLKSWDQTKSGKKMTMEILFFLFNHKFSQAARSKVRKRKSHLPTKYTSDNFFCKMILRHLAWIWPRKISKFTSGSWHNCFIFQT
jgi:hypothetical protein